MVDNAVRERALRYLLRDMNKRKWKKLKRPLLTPRLAPSRLEWAQRYQHIDWKRVKWSDECSVQRGAGVRSQYSFLRPSEQIREGQVQGTRPHGVRQMFWGLFDDGSRSDLIALEGRITGAKIYLILLGRASSCYQAPRKPGTR